MRMLTEPERNIEVITYSELDFGDDFDFEKKLFLRMGEIG